MKKLFILTFVSIAILSLNVKSQTDTTQTTENSSISVNVDFMNRYIWRAIDFGNTPSIQPSFTYSYKNFSIGSWASTSTTGDFAEIDLFASYSIGNFTLLLTDYFYPYDSLTNNNSYFNFKNSSTAHTIEAGIKYVNQKIPVSLGIYSFVYGFDPKPNSTDKYYSTYIELGYSFSLKDVDCEIVGGFTPIESYYAEKFNLVNIGFTAKKNIQITPTFNLPLKASFITNPINENVYFTFGFSL
jgi:hypothetical protein